MLQVPVGKRSQKLDHPVGSYGNGCCAVRSHPSGDEWHERKPEQEVQVGPQDRTVYPYSGLEQMVVIAPKDCHGQETERVRQEEWHEGTQGSEVTTRWHLEFECHDREDDGEDAIAECLNAPLRHGCLP